MRSFESEGSRRQTASKPGNRQYDHQPAPAWMPAVHNLALLPEEHHPNLFSFLHKSMLPTDTNLDQSPMFVNPGLFFKFSWPTATGYLYLVSIAFRESLTLNAELSADLCN